MYVTRKRFCDCNLQMEDDNRWSIREEMEKVFQVALDRNFPGEEPCIVFIEDNKDVGDYQWYVYRHLFYMLFFLMMIDRVLIHKFISCNSNNILTIWPKVADEGKYKDCKAVGEVKYIYIF